LKRIAVIVALGAAVLVVAGLALFRNGDDAPRPQGPATLADYWAGNARWALARKLTGTDLAQDAFASGVHMEIVGDRWYLFNRGPAGGSCPDGELRVGVQVRESRDRGATWSPPVLAVDPAAAAPWSCAASDGDAFYDEARGTWRLLFQCKADGGGWNGCYAERRSQTPMGPFTARGVENPVIRAGDLWGSICDAGDDCGGRPVADEGTFNIFDYDGRDFWISFHGWDGANGFRGIAKTPDFRRFVADRPEAGVPTDAILDAADATGFNEQWAPGGPIGAGAGSVVREGRRLYAINEFADISLSCTAGQNWDLGMFRTDSTASVQWEPYPRGNPVVYSSRIPESNGQSSGCNVLYPTLFRDPATGNWYLMHGRATSDTAKAGIYIYRLEHDTNLLENGDFATGNALAWAGAPEGVTRVDVPRAPDGSPDGTPYLAFNCGCTAGSSVFQDVLVDPGLTGRRFDYGGTLRAEGGEGALTMAVHQLDATGVVLRTDTLELQVGAEYSEHRATSSVVPGARKLRYELYPKSPLTFAADNLFLHVAG
jgi:hypothetical protein